MDEIIIEKIKLRGKHGCFAAERDELRDFEVSMRLRLPFERAAKTDDLSDTVDYPSAMAVAEGVLAAESIWGENLNNIPGLTAAVKADLDSIQEKGMLETVKGIL